MTREPVTRYGQMRAEVLAECADYLEARWRRTASEAVLLERVVLAINEGNPQAKHIRNTLRDLEAYFDDRADADYDGYANRMVGNRAMSLLMDLRALRGER